MKELNNKTLLKTIHNFILGQYVKKLQEIKKGEITLFKTFPHTGAPNISEPVTLTLFENLEHLLSGKYNIGKN